MNGVEDLSLFKNGLNLLEREFLDLVQRDIEKFQKLGLQKIVLIFPPVGSRKRFLIHHVAPSYNLRTFSIGAGNRRVTVVCEESLLKSVNDGTEAVMDSNINTGAISKSRRSIRNDVPLYVPPPARQAASGKKSKEKSVRNVDKRSTGVSQKAGSEVKEDKSVQIRNRQSKSSGTMSNVDNQKNVDVFKNGVVRSNPVAETVVDLTLKLDLAENECVTDTVDRLRTTEETVILKQNVQLYNEQKCNDGDTCVPENREHECKTNADSGYFEEKIVPTEKNQEVKETRVCVKQNYINKKINSNDKDTDEVHEELKRASTEINRKNKTIMKSNFAQPDLLIISHTTPELDKEVTEDCNDWEDLFDESGEFLEQKLLAELTKRVGDVTVKKASEDYTDYTSKAASGDLGHVIEIYNFPYEFKTHDLVAIFADFKNSGFHIKWVDDTHALGVFNSTNAAIEALKLEHPLVKTRPMSEACLMSHIKAKQFPLSVLPVMVRPKTCPQTARRIVSGALGLKLSNAKEEREKERKILKEAREKKKLAAQQQDDAWEGRMVSQS